MLAATDAALLESLGEQQVATLAARGAALETTDAVAYLRAEADRSPGNAMRLRWRGPSSRSP